jgi:hypothetical protein
MTCSIISANSTTLEETAMTGLSQERIKALITRFSESLGDKAKEHVSEAHLADLEFMIRELVSEELEDAVGLMEEVIVKLRSEISEDKPDMRL